METNIMCMKLLTEFLIIWLICGLTLHEVFLYVCNK